MTFWTRLWEALKVDADAAEPLPNGDQLIDGVELRVEARCPCGSGIVHVLALHSHADCPRCSRTFAIRSLSYFRRSPHELPDLQVTIGFVHTPEALRKVRPHRGVH